MTEISERFRKVAGAFTERARGVPAGQWDAPAPCEGWVAHDVVDHMVGWMPSLLGLDVPTHDEPVAAWEALRDTIQSALDDPDVASREMDLPPGRFSFEVAVDMFCTSDVLVHTWDLARATGQDETLDPDEVHRMFSGIEPYDEALRSSGHYGPRVMVPDDADEQTKLIAFTGRTP